jgi:hypothetical protein
MGWGKVIDGFKLLHEKRKVAETHPDGVASFTPEELEELRAAMDQAVDRSVPEAHEERPCQGHQVSGFEYKPARNRR